MSVSTEVDTLMAAARSAMASADWATAKLYLAQALTHLTSIPKSEFAGQSMDWDGAQKSILALMTECSRSLSAATGIQRQKVTRVVVSD
ncbi:MAG: hypothetical protein JSU68_01415 [Phycisphaerales bacterium]|nr:MAG: hypothetical protein JSU68_01415 [Phycisphaerales bacterium]